MVDVHNLKGKLKDKGRKFWNKMNLHTFKFYVCFKEEWEVKLQVFPLIFVGRTGFVD